MRYLFAPLLIFLVLFTAACQSSKPVCPPDSVTYLSDSTQFTPINTNPSPSPTQVDINGKVILVDRIVHGPLCNANWSGTIYVACDVQITQWEEEPTFLQDCSLEIEPGTVVYVAAHNDDPYYKGCSCHTGEATSE
jgi:hypothetical protein